MKKTLLIGALGAVFASSAAWADFIDSFSVSGTAGGLAVSGSALVTYDATAGTLTIKLTNTSTLTANGQVLTDFGFANQDGVTFGPLAATGVTAADIATCNDTGGGNYTCSESAFVQGSGAGQYPGPAPSGNTGSNPWGIATTNDVTSKQATVPGSLVELGAGYTGGTTGTWALHEWGIVNDSITLCTGSTTCDGLDTHIPYLVGPVTFTIPITLAQGATLTDLTDVTFTWGTGPDVITSSSSTSGGPQTSSGSPLPEPNSSTLTLLGLAMIGVTFLVRGRSKRA